MLGRRWRFLTAIGALAACLALGSVAASRSLWYETTDFYCLWSGARLVADRQDPYDEAVWATVTGGLRPDPRGILAPTSCPGRYGYPLWTAFALVPFAALPLPAAAVAWITASLIAAFAGAAASWRAAGGRRAGAALFAAIVLTAQPFWLLLISGQLSGIALGLVGIAALSLAADQDVRAGVSFGLLALKPQLVALCGPALFGWGLATRPRAAVAAAAVVAVMLVSTFAVAPGWPLEWLGEVTGRRRNVVALLPTAWGISADVFGTALVAPLLIAAVTGLAWYLARRRATPVGVGCIALAISIFGTPYAWSYDHLVLVLPWAQTIAIAARSSGSTRIALLLGAAAVASLLPWTLYAIAFTRGGETLNAIVPALTALLVAAAIGRDAEGRSRTTV
ncbi:MAG TPA: glycosyltransferase 87 family protein [Candidatus Limnocylindria bacterium]